jgi:hypothetical protein
LENKMVMKSSRPKARPAAATKKSARPKLRPSDLEARNAEAGALARAMRAAGREAADARDFAKKKKSGGVMKKAKGGMARGCGAATKGKKSSRMG